MHGKTGHETTPRRLRLAGAAHLLVVLGLLGSLAAPTVAFADSKGGKQGGKSAGQSAAVQKADDKGHKNDKGQQGAKGAEKASKPADRAPDHHPSGKDRSVEPAIPAPQGGATTVSTAASPPPAQHTVRGCFERSGTGVATFQDHKGLSDAEYAQFLATHRALDDSRCSAVLGVTGFESNPPSNGGAAAAPWQLAATESAETHASQVTTTEAKEAASAGAGDTQQQGVLGVVDVAENAPEGAAAASAPGEVTLPAIITTEQAGVAAAPAAPPQTAGALDARAPVAGPSAGQAPAAPPSSGGQAVAGRAAAGNAVADSAAPVLLPSTGQPLVDLALVSFVLVGLTIGGLRMLRYSVRRV